MGAYLTHAKVELTAACNHACVFCYNPERSDVIFQHVTAGKRVAFETLCRVIDTAIAFGIESFTFTGGEPLLRRDLLFPALQHVHERKRTASLVSNLSLCTRSDARRLKESGLRGMMTSFHSSDGLQFQTVVGVPRLDMVVRGIEYIRAEHISLKTNIVVSKDNLSGLRDTMHYLVGLGVHSIDVTPLSPTTPAHIPRMLSREELLHMFDIALEVQYEKDITLGTQRPLPHCALPFDQKYDVFRKSCRVEETEITLTAGGDFKICGTDHHVQGNVLEQRIEDLVRASPHVPFVRRDTMTECYDCTQYASCRGGCPTEELVLKTADYPHPYRNTAHPITRMKSTTGTFPVRLLHEQLSLDPYMTFTSSDDGYVMWAYDKTLHLSEPEFAVVSELVRGIVGKGQNPWDVAMEHGLDKNILNTFLHYLLQRGVVQQQTVAEEHHATA